ncbi:MAG: sensor histidine kinase [Candidatus Sumerlaeota bacterium]
MGVQLNRKPVCAEQNDHCATLDYYQQMLLNRLGWLIELRWIGILGLVAGLIYTRIVRDDAFEIRSFLIFALFVQSYNLAFTLIDFYLHNKARATPAKNLAFALAQIFFDLFALTLVVLHTGGLNSIFVICYVFHIIVAGTLLRRWICIIIAAITCIMFDSVVYLQVREILPHIPIEGFTLGYVDTMDQTLPAQVVFHLCLLYNGFFLIATIIASSIGEQLRHREEMIEEYNRDLRRTNTAKSDFMRMASHEMRTPLSAIQGMLEMLIKREQKNEKPDQLSTDLLERSAARTRGLFDLINDLLHYSRLQTIATSDYHQQVNLSVIVSRAIDDLSLIAEQNDLTLESSLQTAWVTADKEQLLILAKNLIGNALRYTPAGGKVEVLLTRNVTDSVLEVIDDGIGIDGASLPYVFEEFFRAPNAKEYEPGGTGLGLAMCKRIVDNHGGSIHVSSVPNKCTVFTVRLPLAVNHVARRKPFPKPKI